MRRPFRHVGVLMIMGIAALGLIAAAYTLWYEDLSLTANVTTAQFDVDWSCQTGVGAAPDGAGTNASAGTTCAAAATRDTVAILTTAATTTNPTLVWADFTDEGDNPTAVPAAKYSQTCSAPVIGSNAAGANGNTGNNNTLTLTLTGLYPFAGCKFALDIDVPAGNYVPAHFSLTAESNNSNGAVKVLAPTTTGACAEIAAALNQTSTNTTTVITTDGTTPVQLHPGDHLFCTFLFYLQELDASSATVAENANFTITATIKAHQFNEPAP